MNIKDAKEQIKNALTVYFTKDEFNNYIFLDLLARNYACKCAL